MSGRRRRALAAIAAVAGTLAVAGCGASDAPAGAGSGTTATTATTASPTAGSTTTTVKPVTRMGDAAIGKTIFKRTCGDCHEGLGTRAFFGPKLSGQGLSEAFIRRTVRDGRNQMPAGRVKGQDYEDIVAYVVSLQ